MATVNYIIEPDDFTPRLLIYNIFLVPYDKKY